jgi:hypothetical protein
MRRARRWQEIWHNFIASDRSDHRPLRHQDLSINLGSAHRLIHVFYLLTRASSQSDNHVGEIRTVLKILLGTIYSCCRWI